MVDLTQVRQLELALTTGPAWEFRSEFSSLARSYGLFLGNDRELREYLAENAELRRALELSDENNQAGFERFLDEVDRLLHNYLAAAATLRDHTRRLWKKFTPADPSLVAAYDSRIKTTFDDSPLARLVQDLRNYTLHRRLPIARGHGSFTRSEGMRFRVVLEREELLDWDNLNPKARLYLTSTPHELFLGEIIDAYTYAVQTFNDWFHHVFVDAHHAHFEELARLEQQLKSAYIEAGVPLT
jgi:hypothetical protein